LILWLVNSHNGTRWVSEEVIGAKAKRKNHEKRKCDMMGIGKGGLFSDVSRCGMGENHLNS
jgi:hypothetical protein